MKKYWYVPIIIVLVILLVRQCEKEPERVVKTVYRNVTDTITNVVIKEVPKKVYVERVKSVKGKDSIVYVDTPNDSTIVANQYDTELKSNNASAKLKITTTGELLDVSGTITYKEKETTVETVKNKSGLFIYAGTPVNSNLQPEVGLLYQFKNKVLLGGGVEYDNLNGVNVKIKLGIKIF